MIGVDLKDQLLHIYLLEEEKMSKWYIKTFRRLPNATISTPWLSAEQIHMGNELTWFRLHLYNMEVVFTEKCQGDNPWTT
jgi:hypothetical protein